MNKGSMDVKANNLFIYSSQFIVLFIARDFIATIYFEKKVRKLRVFHSLSDSSKGEWSGNVYRYSRRGKRAYGVKIAIQLAMG